MYPTPLPPTRSKRRPRRKPLLLSLLILFVGGTYSSVIITRQFTELQPNLTSNRLQVTTQPTNLPWPAYGQGAFGLTDGTVIATNGTQTPLPIASAAKVVTALVILDKHPLRTGDAGPTIIMGQRDVDLYNRYVAIDGSVSGVFVGQRLTQRQMLQLLLLPSANNIGDSLALWSFGSIDAYLAYANQYLQKNGLVNTKVGGDASGYLADSTSTASDLVKLGAIAMRNPALAEILAQKTAVIPGTGTVTNYNSLLGSDGIVGIKTGNNDQNLGVFIGSAKIVVQGRTVTVITALSGAPSLARVLRDSGVLLRAAPTSFATTTIVKKDAVLGSYRQADGQLVQAVASQDVTRLVARGDSVAATVSMQAIDYNSRAGRTVGSIDIPANSFAGAQSVPVILRQAPVKPDVLYRLLHP